MISVILPTLNEEKILKEVLTTLRSKFTIPHQIIVSDGKSTDKTREIAKEVADIVVAYNGTARQTIAQGRNDGAKTATGDFFVFLDADCFIFNADEFFTQALKHFEDQNVVGLAGWLKVLPKEATFADNFFSYWVSASYYVLTNIFHIGASSTEFQMIRAETFRSVHGYNEKLVTGEDIDMMHRLSKVGRTKLDPKLVVYHTGRRVHKLGWPRLLWLWFLSSVSTIFTKKSLFKEWDVIR